MECKNCHSKLTDYIEGGLNIQDMQEVAAHLKKCTSCSTFVIYLRTTLDIIQEEKQIQPYPFLYSRIMARIDSESNAGILRQTFSSFRWIPAVAAGLVLLIGVLGGLGLGKVLAPDVYQDESAISGFEYLVNDMEQEPIEQFLLNL